MVDHKRQEVRLPRSEMLFLEVESGYLRDEKCKILICSSADVSSHGVKAHIDDKLPLDAIYQLCVQLPENERRIYLAAQVKWMREDLVSPGYYVGLEVLDSDGTDLDQWKDYIADLLDRD